MDLNLFNLFFLRLSVSVVVELMDAPRSSLNPPLNDSFVIEGEGLEFSSNASFRIPPCSSSGSSRIVVVTSLLLPYDKM